MSIHKHAWAFAAVIAASGASLCAGAATPSAVPATATQELDEVLVRGAKREKSGQKVVEWMARLAGEFTVEGHVDPHGRNARDDLLAVTGSAICIGFGPLPAVQCDLRVRWPEARAEDGKTLSGTSSTLDPAMLLLGFEANRFGVQHLLVDNRGMAEGASGMIYGDTLSSKTPCAQTAANCQRLVDITAPADLADITLRIAIEIDHIRARTYTFAMKRVPGSGSVITPGRN